METTLSDGTVHNFEVKFIMFVCLLVGYEGFVCLYFPLSVSYFVYVFRGVCLYAVVWDMCVSEFSYK